MRSLIALNAKPWVFGLLIALASMAVTAQDWNVTAPRFSDQSVNIVFGPGNSVPGDETYPTLAAALESIDPGTPVRSIVLGWALRQDFKGIQDDIRSFFAGYYSEAYADLLKSEVVPAEWRDLALREKLSEAIAASRLVAEMEPTLSRHCLEIDRIGFDKPLVRAGNPPVFRAFVGADLMSCI